MNETTPYFPCKIYNNGNIISHEPTFAILSMTPDFGIEDAIEKIKKIPPKNIFIVVNGQQTLYNAHHDDFTDECFGRSLCGIDRQGWKQDGSGWWQGEYKIYTTNSHLSVASSLFDDYGNRDLIIDVLNAKYEYVEWRWEDTKSFDDFAGNLKRILDAIDNRSSLQFFIAGFSRGGMFSLRLAEWLIEQGYGNYRIVVTIDPVQRKKKERTVWDVAWADWKPSKNKWEISEGPQWQAGWNKYKFPILRATAEEHYNVFERDKLIDFKLDVPMGCAVQGAIAPGKNHTGIREEALDEPYRNLPLQTPYDQFDIKTGSHTEMPTKYRDWIIGIADEHFLFFDISPQSGLPKTRVEATRRDGNFDKACPVLFGDRQVETQNVNGKLVFQVPSIKPGKCDVRVRLSLPVSFEVEPYKISISPLSGLSKTRVEVTKLDSNFESANLVLFGDIQLDTQNVNGKLVFQVPDIKPGKYDIRVNLEGAISLPVPFIVKPYNINITPRSGLPGTMVEVTNLDGIFDSANPVFIGDKQVDVQNVDGKLAFQVPDIKPGKWDVRAKFEELYSLPVPFYVEPYIISCEPSECYIDTEVKIIGCFPLVNNTVLFDGKEVPFIIDANGSDTFKYLIFKIPVFDVPKHKDMKIQVLHNGQFYSNAYKPNLICLIGNLKTKELHAENCWCVKRTKELNKNYFCTPISGLHNNGWDNCHWCLGGSKR